MCPRRYFVHLRISQNDDQIIGLGQPCRRPVYADGFRPAICANGISGEARARVNVQHIDLLVWRNANLIQPVLVD